MNAEERRLTERRIATALEPRGVRLELWDTGCCCNPTLARLEVGGVLLFENRSRDDRLDMSMFDSEMP